ncbi:5-formyltetrahydrofolate cyclo-ligase [Candidatus Nitronereus thalassa]|uniref:5-formyltetrahydrofolate cyclo-ligase n=1 Tax=Candidatus Nitronereus thalassa TaxID=3020898 RepID=A0ABU3KAT4_9BACT|nr:5-formyltetrahydrofolate cyclo-ligase [Candidatus Nitronereus thalassa]MDT7043389.1 5-formyltetrahydrofolate cyclo-ligase [Candidatus Nitronereus thalassa]
MECRKFTTKQAARQAVWDQLASDHIARFPFPPHGRIPNFSGAKEAAERLFTIPIFQNATRIKVNPDAPQRYVRELALQRGLTIFVPTPRLKGGFRRFDPHKIPQEKLREAASLSKGTQWGELVSLEELPQLDAIVTGSVAVTPNGHRCGKGEGYGDLEYAILYELGHKPIPVATTVHTIQVVKHFPWETTDLPLSFVVTPSTIIEVKAPPQPPKGIDWTKLSPQDLEDMPILGELKQKS